MVPLTQLSMEFKGMKKDVLHIRHDKQKIKEGATVLEGSASSIEDVLPLLPVSNVSE